MHILLYYIYIYHQCWNMLYLLFTAYFAYFYWTEELSSGHPRSAAKEGWDPHFPGIPAAINIVFKSSLHYYMWNQLHRLRGIKLIYSLFKSIPKYGCWYTWLCRVFQLFDLLEWLYCLWSVLIWIHAHELLESRSSWWSNWITWLI